MKMNIRKTGITDPVAAANALSADGYSVYDWQDFPGASYPPHTHAGDEARWVVRGDIVFGVDGQEYVLGPGDVCYLPANVPHSARTEKGVAYVCGTRAPRE